MKRGTLGWLAAVGAVYAACAAASCSQPKIECQVAVADVSPFAATYELKNTPDPDCESLVANGELVGMQFYHPPTADGTTFDTTKTTVAIQPESLDATAMSRGTDSAHEPYSIGSFEAVTPDAKGICTVPTFSAPGEQDFAAAPAMPDAGPDGGTPALPAESIRYRWSNLQVYVTAAVQGTQFSADLEYTDVVTAADGTPTTCVLDYHVLGVWPAVGCASDDDCNPCAQPDAGRPLGSGLSPDADVTCDTDFGFCVLSDKTGTIPQLLAAPMSCGTIM